MTQTFTANDVVRYLYQEVSDTESAWFAHLLATDDEFRALYQDMRAAKKLMEQVSLEPSDRTVERIMAFSRGCKALVV